MVDNPLDAASGTAKSALGLFDDSYTSYLQVNDWDEGGYYPGPNKGVTVTFDEPQELGMVSFAEVQDGVPFGKVNISYVDEGGAWKTADASMQINVLTFVVCAARSCSTAARCSVSKIKTSASLLTREVSSSS